MEFLLVCPLLVLLVSMILQFSQIWIAREITAYAAYCATRAVLSAHYDKDSTDPDDDEQAKAAQCAAEMVCSWMSLAKLSTTIVNAGETETANLRQYGKFYEMDNRGDPDSDKGLVTVDLDNGQPVDQEIEIPGLGTIPGSDSVRARVETKVLKRGGKDGYACVAVRFKFPLMFPLAGRLISWMTYRDRDNFHYGKYSLTERGGENWNADPAWTGEQTVMSDDGKIEDVTDAQWGDGENHRFPVIHLTEACVLPMSYSGKNLNKAGYPAHVPRSGEDG